MTAEVAVINNFAVALAADSAVTSGGKIYNSADKVFALSKYHPVGIMIYSSASFMNVPWETIIKIYREALGRKKFGTLEEYAASFIEFLTGFHLLIPGAVKQGFYGHVFTMYLWALFNALKEDVETKAAELIEGDEELGKEQLDELINSSIQELRAAIGAESAPFGVREADVRKELKPFQPLVPLAVKDMFRLEATAAIVKRLFELIVLYVAKKWHDPRSGIVISGFGHDELFPDLICYEFQGVFGGKLKSRFQNRADPGEGQIFSFAQQDVVQRFITGIDPLYKTEVFNYIDRVLAEYPKNLIEELPKLSGAEKDDLLKRLGGLADTVRQDLRSQIGRLEMDQFVSPIVSNVGILPKDELAAMAEALVNITSFKRRVSSDEAETVGGPVDVAVITKGDGFIWIKRKHYFDPTLNHQFFDNYYQREPLDIANKPGPAEKNHGKRDTGKRKVKVDE